MCVSLRGISLLLSSPLSPHLVRLKLGSGFHTGHGWFFALLEGTSSFVCFSVPLLSLKLRLPRPVKICLRFAAGALRLVFSAVSLRRCAAVFWGFGFRSAGGLLVSPLSLSLLVFFFVFLSLVRPHFFCLGSIPAFWRILVFLRLGGGSWSGEFT